jgi:hypothetical protein
MKKNIPIKIIGKNVKNPKSPPKSPITKIGMKAKNKMKIKGRKQTKPKGDHFASDDSLAELQRTQKSC